MGLEEEVLKRIVPSPEEEVKLRATAEDVKRRVAERVRALGFDAEALLVGSVAKGTHLRQAELDIFVCFPRTMPRETLEKVGLEVGEFLQEKARMYAEHPYTRGRWNGFEVEVVPCYRITDASERMSAVDRTPLHAQYVIGKLGPNQRNEVRLLKAFCEGIGTYGAEAKVQGFSGYLCELLVLRYGTFRGVLEAARTWRRGTPIELDLRAVKTFPEPLILVDPVDAERNVASAVGEEMLATFVHAAKEYLATPRIEFFFPRPRPSISAAKARAVLNRRGTTLLGIILRAPTVTDDILYPQVRKAHRAVEDLCRRASFRVSRSRFAVVGGEVILLFEFEVFALPTAEKHRGPPVAVKNADEFLKRWRGAKDALSLPYIEGDRWVVDVRREATDAAKLVRVRLRSLSLGSHLDKNAKSARLRTGAQLFTKQFLPEVTRLLVPRFPWE
ncbi:MAG TPA: CCA tRNA nucleotidyltransferase [Thermoplasmata archaeon]|nr:CCA tRNA nucleotidyltransferase [Thermoplasmata archaeon]